MYAISHFVNSRARHRAGRSPKPNHALRAFIAASMLREGVFGINTATAAAVCTGSSRSSVKAALIILQAEDGDLVTGVLKGRETLVQAANKVRTRAKLIESFRMATPADRIAFGQTVGVGALFDTAIVPAL